MADRDYRWRDERSYRRPGGDRDFYRRDEMGEDDYGTGYGEEGMTNYRLREVRGNPRYWRLGEPGDPYARPHHSRHSYPQRDYTRDFSGDFSSDNEYGSRQLYGRGGERSRVRRDEQSDWRGGEQERGFWERAGDEVSSWFGDDDARRRRDLDARHEGRGPKGYRRSDERIREDVSDKLTDDPFIDATDVEVAVSNGEVTLEGTVDSRTTRRRAEDLAERCSGVAHVQNNLRVASASESTREEREGVAKRSSFLKS